MSRPARLRTARPGEAAHLSAIAREAKASWGYPASWLAAWRSTLTVTEAYLARNRVLVAEADGQRAGFVALVTGPNGVEIDHLWVLPAFQRRGIGTALVREGLRIARAGGATSAHVLSDPHAEAFYRGHGFARVERESAPVPGDSARTLPRMRLDLRPDDARAAMRSRALRIVPMLVAGFGLLAGTAFAPVARPLSAQATFRVVAYNIKHGRGLDDKVDLKRVAAVLRALEPDVVTLQEVDDRTERTGGVDQVAELAKLLGMRGFHGPHRPFEGGQYGNAILTRLPVAGVRTHDIPSRPGSELTVHEVAVAVGPRYKPVSVVSVHLSGSPEERLAQADSLSSYFLELRRPVVLAGDFNSQRGDLVLTRLEKTWSVLTKDGSPETYPAAAPDREIDFIMVRPAETFEVVEHRVVVEAVASDHRPVLAVLRIW